MKRFKCLSPRLFRNFVNVSSVSEPIETVFLKDRLRYVYALEAERNRLLKNGCDKETRKFFKRCMEMIKLK